ncbi:MAG: hypothetical protein U5K31_02495 [Balneolaceae bacterium]|nr:hypothetical protein [Balneolaceae bacterium]
MDRLPPAPRGGKSRAYRQRVCAGIIGPLLPAPVNRHNQQLGLRAYREMLDRTPSIALVNEMAFSTSMVDIYAEAGYRGILLDRDNVRLALSLDHTPLSTTPLTPKA